MILSPISAFDTNEECDVAVLSFLRDETVDQTLAVCLRKDGSIYSTPVARLVVQDLAVSYIFEKLCLKK